MQPSFWRGRPNIGTAPEVPAEDTHGPSFCALRGRVPGLGWSCARRGREPTRAPPAPVSATTTQPQARRACPGPPRAPAQAS
jgi:hypothetical protein